MFQKILGKGFSVIRRMNQWWDKDEDKAPQWIVSGIIILIGILILKKPILFIIAFILIGNRIIHRFNWWTKWECSFVDCVSSDLDDYDDTTLVEPTNYEVKEDEK